MRFLAKDQALTYHLGDDRNWELDSSTSDATKLKKKNKKSTSDGLMYEVSSIPSKEVISYSENLSPNDLNYYWSCHKELWYNIPPEKLSNIYWLQNRIECGKLYTWRYPTTARTMTTSSSIAATATATTTATMSVYDYLLQALQKHPRQDMKDNNGIKKESWMIVIDELLKRNMSYNDHVNNNDKSDDNGNDNNPKEVTSALSSLLPVQKPNLPIPMYVKSTIESEKLYFQRLATKILLVEEEEGSRDGKGQNSSYKISMAKLDRYCLTGREPCLFKK